MQLRLERLTSDTDTSIGALFVDDEFQCFTCEDEYREKKVPKETRIPAGQYDIKLRTNSPMATKYRNRYGAGHKGMLWLQDVPGFTYIYIHTGNTDDHTEGCILVGYSALARPGDMMVQQSRLAYAALSKDVTAALEGGDTVSIEIIDRDK